MLAHLPFTPIQVIWTLIFASQLVLLVVLIGRERHRRFPWFTASIVLSALRLLTAELLYERLPMISYNAISLSLACISVGVSLAVLVELDLMILTGRSRWVAGLAALLTGGIAVALWGPWPSWELINIHTQIGVLRAMQVAAVKGESLAAIVALALGLAILIYQVYPRKRAVPTGGSGGCIGWSSRPARILLGITTYSVALIATMAVRQLIALAANSHPLTHSEFERIQELLERLANVPYTALIPVQIWWIYSMWIEKPNLGEPGVSTAELGTPTDESALSIPDAPSAPPSH